MLQIHQETDTRLHSGGPEYLQIDCIGSADATLLSGYTMSDKNEVKKATEVKKRVQALQEAKTPAQVALAIITLMVAVVVFIANQK